MTTTTTPKIYVADLAAYNDGILKGAWLDATLSPEDLTEAVKSIVGDGEEWAIHDYEGFEGIKIGEWESFETVSSVARAIEEHGAVFAGLYDCLGSVDIDYAITYLQENYAGCYESIEDYAENYAEDTGLLQSVPQELRYYFDFKSYGQDMELNGGIFTIETGYREIHVFYNV